MEKIFTIAFCLTILQSLQGQTKADSLEVLVTVTNYNESFYLTKPEKGQGSIHRLLAKRTIQKFSDGSEYLQGMSYEEMANLSKVFNSKGKYDANSKKDIFFLDMMDKTANIKLVAEGWVDYMHLGKINGKWKIINTLWQLNN